MFRTLDVHSSFVLCCAVKTDRNSFSRIRLVYFVRMGIQSFVSNFPFSLNFYSRKWVYRVRPARVSTVWRSRRWKVNSQKFGVDALCAQLNWNHDWSWIESSFVLVFSVANKHFTFAAARHKPNRIFGTFRSTSTSNGKEIVIDAALLVVRGFLTLYGKCTECASKRSERNAICNCITLFLLQQWPITIFPRLSNASVH